MFIISIHDKTKPGILKLNFILYVFIIDLMLFLNTNIKRGNSLFLIQYDRVIEILIYIAAKNIFNTTVTMWDVYRSKKHIQLK